MSSAARIFSYIINKKGLLFLQKINHLTKNVGFGNVFPRIVEPGRIDKDDRQTGFGIGIFSSTDLKRLRV